MSPDPATLAPPPRPPGRSYRRIAPITSAHVREAAALALAAGATHYTEPAGIRPLRAALAALLAEPGETILPEQVIVTTGIEESLFIALTGLAGAGDGVVLVGEGRPLDGPLLQSLGLTAQSAPGPRSKVLLVRAPTGHSQLGQWTAPGLTEIVARGVEQGLAVVVAQSLDDAPGGSVSALRGLDAGSRLILAGELPASTGLQGWRVGYLVAPAGQVAAFVDLKQGLTICTAAVSQHAALAALAELGAPEQPPVPEQPSTSATPTRQAAGDTRVRASLALSRRVADEGTRQRYELLDLLSRTPGAITLGRGDPDLPTPAVIVEAATRAIRSGVDGPVDPAGLPELRAAIAAKLDRQNGIVVDPQHEVVVTTGGQEAIFLLLQAILEPGDEILMPEPRYTAYDVAVNVARAKIVSIPAGDDGRFEVDPDAIEARLTDRTRALLIISPGNPTGTVPSAASLGEVARLAREHDLLVISDEMYERIVYDGAEHVSFGSLPGMRGATVTVGGFSKAFAMTGWRVGYITGPARLMARIRHLKSLWGGCAPVVSQHAALAALAAPQQLVVEMLHTYTARRRMVLEMIDRLGFPRAPSAGAFYAFFDTSSLGLHSYELSRRLLLEAGVFVYPGSGFGERWSTHMRLAWLAPEERLSEALSRLQRWIAG